MEMCYIVGTSAQVIEKCTEDKTATRLCACGKKLIIAEKGDFCDVQGNSKPGCVNDTAKCTPISGTENCKVLAECYCGSAVASKMGDICKNFGSESPKNVDQCSVSNCASTDQATDCTVTSNGCACGSAIGLNDESCYDFANTDSAAIACKEFTDQPCKCGNKNAEVGKKCVNNVITDILDCAKMHPDVDSLTEVCKCGNDQCGNGKFCFN